MLPFFLTRALAQHALRSEDLDAELFARALAHVLAMEGGYSEDPHDPGGPTNLGITLAVYARHRGQPLDDSTFETLKAGLRALSREEAADIYLADYWRAARCPYLPAALAVFHFDAAVNQGVRGSTRMLQRALAVPVDGVIGPLTREAARRADPSDALARYGAARCAHYRSLSTFWRFGRGWLARVDRTLALARAVANDPRFHLPSDKELTSMTDTIPSSSTSPSGAPQAKWWGQSMTIWGVLLTSLSTVLPVVGPLFGLNITAELVQQLGDGVVQVAQAAGGLVGTALAIWGRMRATTPLARTQVSLTI